MNQEFLNHIERHGKKQNKRINWVIAILIAFSTVGNMPNFIPKYNGSRNATKENIKMVQKEVRQLKELITKDIDNMKENDIKHELRFNTLESKLDAHLLNRPR